MSGEYQTLKSDLEELQYLRCIAKRDRTIALLEAEIQAVKSAVAAAAPAPSASGDSAPSVTSSALPFVKIHTYSWDQSEKFVKLYVTVKDVQSNPSGVETFFETKKFELKVSNAGGKNHSLVVTGLLCHIDPAGSYAKAKTDMVVVFLKKKEQSKEWECVTEQEFRQKEKNKPKFDKDADPNASMMSMMKDLYDQGDDEMKRTIKKSMYEAQMKKQGAEMPMEG